MAHETFGHSKENLCLRAHLSPERIFVIPNAICGADFRPVSKQRKRSVTASPAGANLRKPVRIVLLSRLVYRKGIDLAAEVIPTICARFPWVDFVIGGDGPKRLLLEEMIAKHGLQDRVQLAGAISHSQVRTFLTQGDIFLNCSLTEAFCIAILEASCCGLSVVSTRVGGVEEVLPQSLPNAEGRDTTIIHLCDAEPACLCCLVAYSSSSFVLDPFCSRVSSSSKCHPRIPLLLLAS